MKKLLFICSVFLSLLCKAQGFSIATDVTVLHNFSPQQEFWTAGQTVQVNFHGSGQSSFYAWLNYYENGNFHNSFTAPAKSGSTSPAEMNYTVNGQWRFRQLSLGWKRYWKGGFDNDRGWNLYSLAGFGVLFSKVNNTITTPIDTALYIIPYQPTIGSGRFVRLTFDLGLGAELPIGGYTFLYGDVRTWLPASSDPSPYFHNNNHVPLPLIACIGLRLLFSQF